MHPKLGTRLGVIAATLWIGLGGVLLGVRGNDPSRVSVYGIVKLDGKPLVAGIIYFLHTSQSPPQVLGASLIHDGRFSVRDLDSMVTGTYKVRISGLETVLIPEAQGADTSLPADPMPDRFNRESQLEVVIPRGGTFRLEFELKR